MSTLKTLTVSITISFLITSSSCGVAVRGVDHLANNVAFAPKRGLKGKLGEKESAWADVAWEYFKNNTVPETGIVNAVDNIQSATMSTIADYIAALVAAFLLEKIEKKEFDNRLSSVFDFLYTMPLFESRVPNKVYHTKTGEMLDYEGDPGEIGWSAIDLGRLMLWLRITANRFPEFHEYIDKALFRWNYCDVIDEEGSLYAGVKIEENIRLYQEGRFGYEEYAAQGFRSWGFNTDKADSVEPFEYITIYGVDIIHDGRDHRFDGVFAPVMTTPHVLLGIELNWTPVYDLNLKSNVSTNGRILYEASQRVYMVQKLRFINERIYTARAEHILKREPFFLYDSIFSNGYAWNTFSDSGQTFLSKALVSTKAVFPMYVLWPDSYTKSLVYIIEELYDKNRGWYEGRYEASGGYEKTISAATNALVLESMLFKVMGKLYQRMRHPTYSAIRMGDVFKHPGQCFSRLYQIQKQKAEKEKLDALQPGFIKAISTSGEYRVDKDDKVVPVDVKLEKSLGTDSKDKYFREIRETPPYVDKDIPEQYQGRRD